MMFFPFEASVVGVSWHQDDIANTHAGDPVEVHAEPNNEYDSNARAVFANKKKIGYLARAVSKRLADDDITDLVGVVTSRGGQVVHGVKVLLERGLTVPVDSRIIEATDHPTGHTTNEEHRRTVRVRGSGRVIGALVSRDREHGRVTVESARGTVEYSDDLVIIDEMVAS